MSCKFTLNQYWTNSNRGLVREGTCIWEERLAARLARFSIRIVISVFKGRASDSASPARLLCVTHRGCVGVAAVVFTQRVRERKRLCRVLLFTREEKETTVPSHSITYTTVAWWGTSSAMNEEGASRASSSVKLPCLSLRATHTQYRVCVCAQHRSETLKESDQQKQFANSLLSERL
jgi:hypothetical protein